MTNLSLQEIFDKGTIGVLRQGTFGYNHSAECCVYSHTTPEGDCIKCAVGHLINDSLGLPLEEWSYSVGVDHLNEEQKEINAALCKSNINIEYIKVVHLLVDMQDVHDRKAETWQSMEHYYQKSLQLATDYSLDTTAITAVFEELYSHP